MIKLKKIRKNEKAISPVLAVLLMIAVAVAAALVTYAWVMTYLSSTTSRAGHAIQIQSVDFASETSGDPEVTTYTGDVTIYAQNVGDGTLIITNVYLDGALSATISEIDGTTLEGETTEILISLTAPDEFTAGQDVHIKVVCDDGTFTSGTYTVE